MSHAKASRIRRLSSALASAVLAVLAVFALLLVVLGVVARPGHDGISRVGGHPMLTVLSGSMTPVFRPGDLVVDDAVPTGKADQLVPGDIITFHVPNSATELITHKIVAVKHDKNGVSYQTRGVANNAPDPELVQPSQVVGTYRMHVPYAGYLLQAVQKKTIFFLLIIVPLLYLGGTELAKRGRQSEPSTIEPQQQIPSPTPAAQPAAEPTHEQLVGASTAPTHRDAISALRRSESWLFETPAKHVTGEGGDASV